MDKELPEEKVKVLNECVKRTAKKKVPKEKTQGDYMQRVNLRRN